MPFPTDPVLAEKAKERMRVSSHLRWSKKSERDKASAGQKKRFSDPLERERISELTKIARQSDTFREKMSAKMRDYFSKHPSPSLGKRHSEETKRRVSLSKKKQYLEHPELKQLISEETRKRFQDPDYKERIVSNLLRYNETPEGRKKRSDNTKKQFASLEARRLHGERARQRLETDDARRKIGEAVRKHYLDKEWYGSVRYYDGPQYCEKFNSEFRERVRAYWGYRCFECGMPQNGKKLSVHHVHYDKKMCCNGSPQDVVPLCGTCHTASNHNRDYWEDHFTELLYSLNPEGKCFLTKEEMKQLNGGN